MGPKRQRRIPLILLAVFFFIADGRDTFLCMASDRAGKRPAPDELAHSPPRQLANSRTYGDAIVVSSIGDARTLVPILASDSASSDICGMVFNGLVKYDKDINIVPDLAQEWEIKEGGLVIIFHLRKGVK